MLVRRLAAEQADPLGKDIGDSGCIAHDAAPRLALFGKRF
jgi:hypothetical protein